MTEIAFPIRTSGEPIPYDVYRRLREQAPVARVTLWDGRSAWLVTRYEDVRAVLANPNLTVDRTRPGFPALSEAAAAVPGRSFMRMDPPDHGVYRRLLGREFLAKRVEAMRPAVHSVVDSRIALMRERGSGVDLVRDFALPVPSIVMCELLGTSYDDHELFETATAAMVSHGRTAIDAAEGDRMLRDFAARLIEEKRAHPQDDLISRLVRPEDGGAPLSDDDLVGLIQLLVIAGHETSANMIALAALTFMEQGLVPEFLGLPGRRESAVDEILRYLSVAHLSSQRMATERIELEGATIEAGEGIIALLAAANHDDARFELPDDVNLTRTDNHHVAFGYGIHQCLGQSLARLELQESLGALFEAFPDLMPTNPGGAEIVTDGFVLGVRTLPVTWGQS